MYVDSTSIRILVSYLTIEKMHEMELVISLFLLPMGPAQHPPPRRKISSPYRYSVHIILTHIPN